MGDMLKFKKGTFSGLPETKSAGTIYVTTDEKAMYVDISSTERIRLGQIVNFDTLANFQAFLVNTSPPYDQQAFYYIEDKNALLRWKSNDGSTNINNSSTNATNGTWVQINSVADVQASLATLEGKVGDNTAAIAQLRTEVGPTDKAVSGKTIYDRLDAVESTNNTQDTSISTLNETVGIGDSPATTSHKTRIEALENKVGEDGDNASGIFGRLKTIEGNVGTNTAGISANAEAIEALQAKDKTHDKDIQDLLEAIGTGTGTDTLSGRINTLENVVGVTNYDSSKGTHTARIKALEEQDVTLTNRIAADEKALSDYKTEVNTALGEVNTALGERVLTTEFDTYKDDISSQINTINNTLTSNTANIASNAANIASNAANIASNTAKIGENFDLINTKADQTALEETKTNLQNLINEKIKTADAMTYIGAVSQFSELPTTSTHFAGTNGTRIGDTFIASSAFKIGEKQVYAGDLLIAKGTEDASTGYITSNLTWDVVDTGYIESHENSLTADVADSAILLNAHTGNELSRVTFVADGALKASVDAYNNVKYTIEWEEF